MGARTDSWDVSPCPGAPGLLAAARTGRAAGNGFFSEPPEGTNPVEICVSDFLPPQQRVNKILLFEIILCTLGRQL